MLALNRALARPHVPKRAPDPKKLADGLYGYDGYLIMTLSLNKRVMQCVVANGCRHDPLCMFAFDSNQEAVKAIMVGHYDYDRKGSIARINRVCDERSWSEIMAL